MDGIIPWGTNKGLGGTEEHVLILGGDHLHDAKKDFVDPVAHGVICEF